jgi:uncharacterized protein (DUF1684 family)
MADWECEIVGCHERFLMVTEQTKHMIEVHGQPREVFVPFTDPTSSHGRWMARQIAELKEHR